MIFAHSVHLIDRVSSHAVKYKVKNLWHEVNVRASVSVLNVYISLNKSAVASKLDVFLVPGSVARFPLSPCRKAAEVAGRKATARTAI